MPLISSSPLSSWIHDFVNSDAPQFEGKSKAKRIKMAIAAYNSRNESTDLNELNDETIKRVMTDSVKKQKEMIKNGYLTQAVRQGKAVARIDSKLRIRKANK